VLDYGGGDGRWAIELAERAALVIVADVDEHALRSVPSHPRLQSVLVDGVTLPFHPGAFDLVFVNHVLHHVEDLSSVVAEVRRVVRKDGRLVIIEFDPSASVTRVFRFLSRYREHPCTLYTPRALIDLMRDLMLTAEERRLDDFHYGLVAAPLAPSHPR
jgi:ubiquinone/menaquinone biosynthesis C-methylase UbiE